MLQTRHPTTTSTIHTFQPDTIHHTNMADQLDTCPHDAAPMEHHHPYGAPGCLNPFFVEKHTFLHTWLQQQYNTNMDTKRGCDQNPGAAVEAEAAMVTIRTNKADRHELTMLCAKLHYEWQNERAKGEELRSRYWAQAQQAQCADRQLQHYTRELKRMQDELAEAKVGWCW